VTALILMVAIASRVSTVEALLIIGAIRFPVPTAIVILGLTARSAFVEARRSELDPAVGVVVSVAGDLRAGRPLRAIVASGSFGERLASVAGRGLPITAASTDWLSEFGPDAVLVQATLELAVDAGGPVAGTFDKLAVGMIEAERTRRDRRAAMAPAVAQAVVVGGVPLVMLAEMIVSGRWLELVARGTLTAALVIGGTFAVLLGVGWIASMVGGRH
jgi:Flp pilus assembly protein TadB